MLSKNNLKELNRKQEPKKQRFALKKLTIGVASVLIGFTFMGWSNTNVKASTTATPTVTSSESGTTGSQSGTETGSSTSGATTGTKTEMSAQTSNSSTENSNSGTQTTNHFVVLASGDSGSSSSTGSGSSASGSLTSPEDNSKISSDVLTNNATSKADFTGRVSMGQSVINSTADANAGYYHNDYNNQITPANGIIFGTGSGQTSTTNIAYQLMTNNGQASTTHPGYSQGPSQFILYIPTGFSATNITINRETYNDTAKTMSWTPLDSSLYEIKKLTDASATGMEAYLLTFKDIMPVWSSVVTANAQLTVNANATAGRYTASASNLLKIVNNGAFNASSSLNPTSSTITIDGQNYPVLTYGSMSGINDVSYQIGDTYQNPVYFTGTTTWAGGNTNTYGTGSSDTKTTSITYGIGSATLSNGYWYYGRNYYNGTGKYILFIPRGFSLDTSSTDVTDGIHGLSITSSDWATGGQFGNDVKLTNLGSVGSNGEEAILVETTVKPGATDLANPKLTIKADLVANAGNEGKAYANSTGDLMKAVVENGSYEGTSSALTVGSNNYQVVSSSSTAGVDYTYGFNANSAVTFTGTTYWTDGNNQNFTSTSSTNIRYKIQSSSDTGKYYYLGQSQYLLYIPAGFTANASDVTVDTSSNYGANYNYGTRYGTSNVKIQKLTGTGPNGEDVFLVTVPNKPSWNCPLYINAKLTPTSQAGGGYSESTSSLLKIIVNNNDVGGTTSSVKVGNTTYTVVAATGNNDGTNNAQYYSYTFPNVGTSELASDSYWIGSVTASLVNTDATSNQTGHELLTIHKLHIKPGKIQNGSYINIKMGLTDSNNQLIPYDKTLADTKPVTLNGTQIGTLYGLGKLGYYRLVFNEAAVSANATKAITLNGDNDEGIQVVWNRAGSRYPSLDKDNGVDLLYQYTANASQNNSRFSVTPQKDITIGTYTYTSGYTVYGRYVLQGNHYQANKTTGPIWSYSARTWLTNTALGGPQGWFQNFNEALDTDDLGNDFSITVKAPKSTDQITINAATADQLAKEIEDIESSSAKLTNTVNATQVNGQNLYANVETTKPTTVIKPTVTLTTSTGTDGLTTYTYHVKFGSAVPSLSGTVWLLSAGTSMPFTVPNGITTYNDDKAKTITKGNYSGHDTSNQTLLTALSTLPKVQVVVRKTGASKDADDTTSSWGGAVQISSPTDLAANQVAASVSPYTVNTQTITGTTRQKPSDLDVQSGITAVLNDGQVISNGLNLIDWTKTHWFDSTKDQATWNKVYGTSGSKEPSYPKINDYGYLVQTEAGTTEPYTATIVFKDGSELFADIPVVVNATDADQATDVAYADSIFNGGNELNYHEVTFQLLVRDKNGNPVLGSDGKPTYKTVTKKIYESSLKDDWNSTKDGKPVYALNLYHQASDFVRNVEEGATYSFDNTKTITAYNGKDTKNIGVTTDQLMSNYNDHSIVNAFGDYRQFNIVIKATYADGSSRLINSRMTVLDTPLGNNVYVRWGGTDGKGTCPKPLNSWIVNLDTTGTEFWKPQAVTTYDDDDFNRPDLMPDLTDPNNLNQTGAVIVSYKNVDGQMDSDGNIVSPAATGQVWSAAVTFKVVGFQTTNHYIFQGQTNPYKFPTASLTLGDATNNYGYLGDFIVDKDDGSGNVDKTTHVRGVGKSVLSESMPVNTTLTAKWVKGSLNTAIAGDNDLQETLTFSTNPGTNYTQIKLIDGITTDSNGGYGDVAPDITYLIHPNGDLTKTNTTMSKTARLVVLALPTGGTIHLHKGNANNVTTLDNWLTSNGTNKGDAVSASDKAITNIDTTKDYMPHAITGWNDPTTVHNEIANAGTYYAEVMVTYQDPNDATKTITIPYATLASLIKNQNKVTIVVQPYVLKDADIWVWYGDKNDYEANAGKQETLSFDNPLIWNSLFPQIVQIPYSDWPSTKISIKMPDKVGYEQPADAEITYKDGSTQVIQVGVLALQYPTLKPIVLNSGDDTKVLSTTILDTLGSTSSNKNAGEINGSTDGYVSNTPGNYQMRVTLTYNVPDASRFDKSIYQSVEKHAFTINVLRLGELQKGYTGSNASLIVTVDPTTGVVNKITLMKQSDDGSKAVPKDTYKRQKDGTYVDNNGNIFGAKKDDTKAKVSTVKTTAFKVADFEQLINMNQMAGMFVSLAWAPESKVSLKDNQLTGTVQAKLKTGNTINIPVDTTVELDEQPGTGNKGGSTTPTKPSTGDKGSTTTPTKPSTGDKGGTTSPTKPSTGDKAGTTMPTKPSTGDKGDTTTPTKSSTGNKGGSTTPTKPSTNDKGGTTTPTKPSTGNKGGTTTPTKPSTGDKGGATTPTKPNTGNKGGTTTPTKPSSGDKGDTTTPTKSNTGNKGGTTTPTKPSTGNKGGSTTPTKPSDQHKGQTDPDATNYDLPSLLMIIYRDGNGQTVKTDQVEGKVGSSTTLIFAVPAGYHVVGTLPSSSYTFNGSDMPLIIEVAKDVAPTTPTKPSTGDKGGATTPAKPSTGDKGGTTPTKPSTGNKGGTTTPTKPSSGNKGGTTTPTKPSTGNKGDTTTPTKPSTGNKGGTTTPTKPSTGNKGGTTAPTKPSDQHKGQTDSDATNYDLPSLLMIIYRDGNGQTIKTDQVEGKVGSSTTLTFAVPAGYHVVGTLPSSSYTFNGSDMPLIIDVAKDVASTTPTAPTKPSSGNKGGTTAPTKPSTGDKGSTTTPTKPSTGDKGSTTTPTKPSTGDKGSTTTPTKPSTGDKGSTTTPTKPSTGDKGSTTTPTKPNTGNKGGSTTTPAKPTTGDKGSTTTPTKPSTDDKGSTTTPAKPSTGNKGGTTTPTKPSTGNKGGTTTKPSAGDKGGTTTPTTPRKPNNHQSATDQQPTTHDLPSLLLVVYRDQAGQTLKIDEASGMAGSHTTLHFAAPNGYHIVGNTPNTDYTFNGQDAPILIEVAKDNQKSTGSTSATPTAQDHSTISAQPSDTVANQQQPTTVTKLANDSVIKQSDINQSANGNITTAHQSSTQDVTAVPQTNQYVYQQIAQVQQNTNGQATQHQQLPQTGNRDDSALVALGISGMLASLGIVTLRKREA